MSLSGSEVQEETDLGLLNEIVKDMGLGRTVNTKKIFHRHMYDPTQMSAKTLWALYLIREEYRKEAAYRRLRLDLIERILKWVPHSVKSKVDPKAAVKAI